MLLFGFSFKVQKTQSHTHTHTHRQTHKVTDATDHPTDASATANMGNDVHFESFYCKK